ncbi:c6 zinc finger domain protein [Ophiostoma piceae UAMH 11346]|uniref:C6 zinc finger domain protein n=1 Tax=Ophiostoma piceae (strain UAMH 11346) TaxID=1262450 RepID=S3BZ41_OPHP1|nr:c6 zinc finger domain protein [Ophiostoma piceae UAMH 11346]
MAPNPQHQHASPQNTARLSSQASPAAASASASAAVGSGSSAGTGPGQGTLGGDAPSTDPKTSKRVRTSRPKVKTGCNNCKLRRIKCDEKRPACTHCVRSSKECYGYPAPARSARPFEEIRIAPKPMPLLVAAGPRPGLAPAPLAPALQQQTALRPLQQTPLRQQPPYPNVQPHPAYQKHLHQQVQLTPRRAQKLTQRRNNSSNTSHESSALIVAAATPTLTYHPSVGLPFSQQEGLYFTLFRAQTANELSGFFDDIFWSRSVLVECHSEAAIRHAVVALGALYKTLEKTTESPPTSPSVTPNDYGRDSAYGHWEIALRQYDSACRALAVLSDQDDRTQRTRLMASVLLACFDSFIGDHKQAIVQIQTGLGLLDRVRTEHRQSRGSLTSSEPVEDELTQMFARLAIQAKSYDMAFHFPMPYVIQLLPASARVPPPSSVSEFSDASSPASPPASSDVGSPVSLHQDPIPDRFVSLRQARLSWDTLCEQIFRFMEVMFQYANGPPNLLPKHMLSHGLQFGNRIKLWSDAFEQLLLNRVNPGVTSQEKAGIAVLKMFQIMALILYMMTFSDSEMAFDKFQPHFKAIVDLANEVVGDEERRAAAVRCPDPTRCVHRIHEHGTQAHGFNFSSEYRKGFACKPGHIKASFSADLGIVPPLFVVATKSRDRVLRRQAIQLLRSSARREGMWDSELVARIAMWVVDIEEEGEEEEFMEMVNQHRASVASAGDYSHMGSVGSVGSAAGPDASMHMVNAANLPSPASSMASLHTLPPHTSTTPSGSPGASAGIPSPSAHPPMSGVGGQAMGTSVVYSDVPLGPGGNARWGAQRAMQATALHGTAMHNPSLSGPVNEAIPYYMQIQRPISAEKRILVKACEFDLREHTARLQCGTRGLATGLHDNKTRVTKFKW